MKQMTEYNRVSGYLNKIFALLNASYFENALSKPVITIQSTPKAYGHVTVTKVWTSEEEERHELNIGAGTLTRPIENVVATMLHEMVHLYNLAHGIKDTSRGYTYHNTKFRDEAVKRDLVITHDDRIGWSHTEPSERLIEWCIENGLEEIRITRHEGVRTILPPPGGKAGTGATGTDDPNGVNTKKPSSTRKYTCPECGQGIRATKDVNLICGCCYASSGKIVHLLKV